MTETWNRILESKNKHFKDNDIQQVRNKFYEMDSIVLKAYGWDDLETIDDKEIIVRLRKLNEERAFEEILAEEASLDLMLKEANTHIKKLGNITKNQAGVLSNNMVLKKLLIGAGKKFKKVQTEVSKAQKNIKVFKEDRGMVDANSKKKIHNTTARVRKMVDEILILQYEERVKS
jgi:hypothetical protein